MKMKKKKLNQVAKVGWIESDTRGMPNEKIVLEPEVVILFKSSVIPSIMNNYHIDYLNELVVVIVSVAIVKMEGTFRLVSISDIGEALVSKVNESLGIICMSFEEICKNLERAEFVDYELLEEMKAYIIIRQL